MNCGKTTGDKIKMILTMAIFGTIGIFREFIPYPSSLIAFARGMVGALFLGGVFLFQKRKIPVMEVKRNGLLLVLSGALLGINWILLFEAYRYTAVSVATICYYTAPLLVVAVSPFILHEKITVKKALCVLISIGGLVMVSEILSGKADGTKGILLALAAAVIYAAIILLNKFVSGMEDSDRTFIQLTVAAAVLLPYVLITEDMAVFKPDVFPVIMLLITGILHTGIAYSLYFGSIRKLPAQTVAVFSYIDPVTAVVLSVVFLREKMTYRMAAGIILILGASIAGEFEKIDFRGRKRE